MIILPNNADFRFDAENHKYYYRNKKVVGVSSAMKAGGLLDFGFVKTDVLEQSQEFGSAVHLAAELYDRGTLDESTLDSALRPYLDAWIRFRKDSGFIIEHIETPVYSERHNFMGTPDRVGLYGARRAILDIKSGLVYPSQAIQLSAYQEAYSEGLKMADKAKDRIIVQLKGDGTYSLPKKDFFKTTDFGVFKSCLMLKNWKGLQNG